MDTLSKSLKEGISNKIQTLAQVADEIPGVIIVHLIHDLSVVYISKRGREYLGLTLEMIQTMGADYYTRYFNKEDVDDYVPKIAAMFEQNNMEHLVSYFQQVRRHEDSAWAWHFSTSRIFMQDHEGRPLLSITISLPVDPEQHVSSKLERLLEEYTFFRKNRKLYLSLTVREKEILKHLALSRSAADIAEDLVISPLTVETHRKNLRKKLNITSGYELSKFARAFDLI